MIRVYTLLLSILVFFACQKQEEKPDPEQEMWEKVEQKVQEFILTQQKECREGLYESASYRADSMLIALARGISRDTFPRPPRLPKPLRPELKTPIDSLPVAPLWRKKDSIEER
jgi:hypothetical protein